MAVKTTDKRKKVVEEAFNPKADPIQLLFYDLYRFAIRHPQYPELLKLPRATRKQLGAQMGKLIARYPQIERSDGEEE